MPLFLFEVKQMKKWLVALTFMLCALSIYAVYHNHAWYGDTIVKVTATQVVETMELEQDKQYVQQLTAVDQAGKSYTLYNTYSDSRAFDQNYTRGDELFIADDHILGVKRDKYIVIAAWLFIAMLVVVGRKQGIYSLMSFGVNVVILVAAITVYVRYEHVSLLLVSAIAVVLFAVISIVMVNGRSQKATAALIATLLGTGIAFSVAALAMFVTKQEGLHYEEMQFLTRPYHTVFLAGLLIGSLGAVMDVAITMTSALFSMQHTATLDEIKQSGREIGKDIMGTITNILFFAYVSGSIPMLLLYFKNGLPFGYTLSMNLSLEIARALAGGIGVVSTIPISLYISLWLMQRKQVQ